MVGELMSLPSLGSLSDCSSWTSVHFFLLDRETALAVAPDCKNRGFVHLAVKVGNFSHRLENTRLFISVTWKSFPYNRVDLLSVDFR